MKMIFKRFACYNAALIVFFILKYILYVNVFSEHTLAFELVTTLAMVYLCIKVFSWGKLKFNYIYAIYICLIIGLWAVADMNIGDVGSAGDAVTVANILLYTLKNYSTYLFIIMEPVMIASGRETAEQ